MKAEKGTISLNEVFEIIRNSVDERLYDLSQSFWRVPNRGVDSIFELTDEDFINDKIEHLNDLIQEGSEDVARYLNDKIDQAKVIVSKTTNYLSEKYINGLSKLATLMTEEGRLKFSNYFKEMGKNFIYDFKPKHLKKAAYPVIAALLLEACAAIGPVKQPIITDTHPGYFSRQYTAEEIASLRKAVEIDPEQFSQEYGKAAFSEIYWKKSNVVALELAQLPQVNDADGINPLDARFLWWFYNKIPQDNINPDIFKDKPWDSGLDKVKIVWQGNKPSDWSGNISLQSGWYGGGSGMIVDAEPIGFEPGDNLDFNKKHGKYASPRWKSKSNKNDTDGVLLTLRYSSDNQLNIYINNKSINVSKSDIQVKGKLEFNKKDGLDGTLTIKNAYETDLTPELFALREMTRAGKGPKYSAMFEAMWMGFRDGHFKEGDNPFENYKGPVELVKPIWGDMKGADWEDFDTVVDRLNTPELVDYYEKKNFTYKYYISGTNQEPGSHARMIFKDKNGNCDKYTTFTVKCLKNAGYKAWSEFVITKRGQPHFTTLFINNNMIYILDGAFFNNDPNSSIRGPFTTTYQAKQSL